MEELQCSSCVRAFLNLIQYKNRFPRLKYRFTSKQRREEHRNIIDFQRSFKNGTVIRVLEEVQIYDMLVILFRKIEHRISLSALPAPFD